MPDNHEDPYSINLPETWEFEIQEDDSVLYKPKEGKRALLLQEFTRGSLSIWFLILQYRNGEEWAKDNSTEHPQFMSREEAVNKTEELAQDIEAGNWD